MATHFSANQVRKENMQPYLYISYLIKFVIFILLLSGYRSRFVQFSSAQSCQHLGFKAWHTWFEMHREGSWRIFRHWRMDGMMGWIHRTCGWVQKSKGWTPTPPPVTIKSCEQSHSRNQDQRFTKPDWLSPQSFFPISLVLTSC